jgi:NAD(P)H-flavin reductase
MYVAESASMVPTLHEIERVIHETRDTFTIELSSHENDGERVYRPGQFNMIYAFGTGEAAISISGDPHSPDALTHTIRSVGSVTKALASLKKGDQIGVRGPFGNGWPLDVARGHDIVIVAGGIGLAPLRPLIYEILRDRSQFGNVAILYGARSPEEILYEKELREWRSRLDLEVIVTVDRASAGWHGCVGVVTKLIPKTPFNPYRAVAYVCGPEIMMNYAITALKKQGLSETSIHVSMERNMKCGVGHCGHCQFGSKFVCKDGPVFRLDEVNSLLDIREV